MMKQLHDILHRFGAAMAMLWLAVAAASAQDALPLPSIPAELREPQQRAAWLMEHFWDSVNMADSSTVPQGAAMSQAWADYCTLVPLVSSEVRRQAFADVLTRFSPNREALLNVVSLGEDYLGGKMSPVYHPAGYEDFLQAVVDSPCFDEYEKERPAYLLRMGRLNAVGTVAADFGFTLPDGTITTLSATDGRAELRLLLMFDPLCHDCQEEIAALKADPDVTRLVDEGRLQIIAVYAEGEEPMEQAFTIIPDNWLHAYADSALLDDELYYIPQYPVAYLIDSSRVVLLKEPAAQELIASLKKD